MEIPSCSHEAFFPQSPKVDCDDMHFNNMIFCKTFKIASSILHKFCDDSRRVSTDLGGRRTFCEVHLPSIISFFLHAKIDLPSTSTSARFFAQCFLAIYHRQSVFFQSKKTPTPGHSRPHGHFFFSVLATYSRQLCFVSSRIQKIASLLFQVGTQNFRIPRRWKKIFEFPFGSEVDR